MNASSPLSSAIPFPVYTDAPSNKEESTRLQLPAAEGSGTFQPQRIHSNSPPRHSQQLDRNRSQEQNSAANTSSLSDLPTQRSHTWSLWTGHPTVNTQPTSIPSLAGTRARTRTFFRLTSKKQKTDLTSHSPLLIISA